MNKVETYLHKASTNRAGKWLSIALSNLVKEMSVEELRDLLPRISTVMIQTQQAIVDRLRGLGAPPVIMEASENTLARAKEGKHSHIATVRRELAKREVHCG